MNEIVLVVEEAPEGGHIARALRESISVEADSPDELREAARDAVRMHFDKGLSCGAIRLRTTSAEK